MKTLGVLIVCCVSVALAEDFKTLAGQEYKDATVTRVEPDGIVLITNAGVAKVYFAELPRDVQERFHYDPAKASAFATEQNAQYEMLRKQREEARQKQAAEMEKERQNKIQQQDDSEQEQRVEKLRQKLQSRTSSSASSRSQEGMPEQTYELVQDYTIVIRGGIGGASIRLRRGDRFRGRILADHAEIDINGYSYWVPSGILRAVRE